MKRNLIVFSLLLLTVLLIGACAAPVAVDQGSAAMPSEPQSGGSLLIGKAQEAVGLDPHLITARSSFELTGQVYNQLVDLDDNYAPIAELAASWENPDDTTFIFTLRDDVTFQNGRPLVAEDVKYSFERIKAEETASPWATQLALIESIETPDDLTVVVNLSEPFGAFMSTIASSWAAIVPAEEVEANGDLQSVMVGTGPFMLDEYTAETQTVLEANPDYFDGAPMVDELVYKIIPDEAARLAALRTGEIHMSALADNASAGLAARSDGVSVADQQTTDYYLLGLNNQREPFTDPRVRQAMSMAVDRDALINSVFFGEGLVAGPIVETLGDWATPVEELPNYTRDVEGAKVLLAEAGYPDGFETTITASPRFPQFTSIALVLQNQLKDVGITVTLDQVEWGTFVQKWIDRDYDTFVSFNGSGNDPDRALYPMLYTDGSVNAFQFSDAEIDAMLDEARTTVDRDARVATYHELNRKIAELAPLLFLSTRTEYVAARDEVQGFELSPVDTYRSLKDVWIAQ